MIVNGYVVDKIKNEYCNNNKIKLLRISYNEFKQIDIILMRELND